MANELARLFVTLGVDDKELQTKLKTVQRTMTDVSKVALGMGAGMTAALGLSVKAAEEERINIGKLSAALKNVGVDYDKVADSLEDVIQQTMRKTGVADDAQRDALAALTIATQDYDKSLKLLPLAIDLAAAKSMDLETAAELVGKVAVGNTSVLTRYGIVLREGATASEALAEMQERVAGAAEATASPIAIMKNTLEDVTEDIGAMLLPMLQSTVDRITPVVNAITDWMNKNPALAQGIVTVAAVAGGLFTVLGSLGMIIPKIAAGFVMLNSLMGPVGWIAIAAGALVGVTALAFGFGELNEEITKTDAAMARVSDTVTASDPAWKVYFNNLDKGRTGNDALAAATNKANDAMNNATKAAKETSVAIGYAMWTAADGTTKRMQLFTEQEVKAAEAAGQKVERLKVQQTTMTDSVDVVNTLTSAMNSFVDSEGKAGNVNIGGVTATPPSSRSASPAGTAMYEFDALLTKALADKEFQASELYQDIRKSFDISATAGMPVNWSQFLVNGYQQWLARPMAEGGIVKRPTYAMIGESGPEAVVPLSKGNVNPVINIYFNDMAILENESSIRKLGQLVYNEIKRDNRLALGSA